jgi:hypothetical protein
MNLRRGQLKNKRLLTEVTKETLADFASIVMSAGAIKDVCPVH